MDQSVRPGPLISELLPGALALGFPIFDYFWSNLARLDSLAKIEAGAWAVSAGAFLLLAWIIGALLDAIRNGLVETWLDRKHPINWDFFFTGEGDKILRLNEHYYAYYKLDMNFVLAILAGLLFRIVYVVGFAQSDWKTFHHVPALGFGILAIWIFYRDARCLRSEIQKLLGPTA